ncbi:MAG: CDP-glycerol glycerophosphotransferase family protein [Eubacteriales bacterium]|nr:CDP-glycerol glycerophosphotransferase family protein [Eubacteriales bacterium]
MGKRKNLLLTGIARMGKQNKPDPRIWVFSSTDNRHFNYNSKYLFEYVREHYPKIHPLFVINDRTLRKKLSEEYGPEYFVETESMEGVRKVLGAGVWFTSAGLPVYGLHLKKDRVIVNLWHGVPLKKIGLLDPNLSKAGRLYFRKLFTENYSYILTTSNALIPTMEKSFDAPRGMVKVWGQPRNDMVFCENNREEIMKSFYRDLPEYRKVILYAPTFRDGGRTQLFPFADYDRERMNRFLEKEKAILCIRTHIKEKESTNLYLSDRIRYLGNEEAEDITSILNIFDVLITDYSSIYIDYLLTKKPIIFLPYDKDEYLANRGMNFPYDKVTPGPKPATMKEFQEYLQDFMRAQNFWESERDEWMQERARCCHFFNEVQEPCSERICREIIKEVKQRFHVKLEEE